MQQPTNDQHNNTDNTPEEQRGGVAKRLIISLTLCICLVLSVVSAMQIYVAYEQSKGNLRTELGQYAFMTAPAFSQALWNLDFSQTYLTIDGLLTGENVYGVQIFDENGTEFASLGSLFDSNQQPLCKTDPEIPNLQLAQNKKPCLTDSKQFISISETITFNQQRIGTITIYGNRDRIYELIRPLVISTLLSALIIITALSVIALVVIELQIGKPVRALTKIIHKLDYISIDSSWRISSQFTSREDELGELSKAFDQMVTALLRYQTHLEDIVAERTEKLRIANESKSDFLSQMSHEIRTPINGVLGLAELMLHDDLSAEARQRTEMIYKSGSHLLNIVNDILDLSKIEAGKLSMESVPVNLRELAGDVISLFSNNPKCQSIKLQLQIDDLTPENVYTDPLRLKQILINLLGNAFKFTERGAITLAITPVSDTTVKFSVTDTGAGITEEKIPNLFQAFNQGDLSTTRTYGGTGLGLTICKKLVEMMGGEIGASSILNEGSCFYFTVILPKAESATIKMPGKTAGTNAAIKPSVKILVAEDNAVNQAVIKGMLNKLGNEPVIVEQGQAVMDLYENNQNDFDIILMDCEMPVMDGWEASRRLRERNAIRRDGTNVLIIGLSAHAVEGANQRAIDAGMDDYLTKPLSIIALTQKLQRYDLLA